jgi:hypothetical protein
MAQTFANGDQLSVVRDVLNGNAGDINVLQSQNAKSVSDVAALLANTSLTYTVGSNDTVAAGNIVQTRAENFSYQVAASSAVDQHVTTSGGVKLYVQRGSSGFNVKSFGAKGDYNGTTGTDDTAPIRAALATGGKVYVPEGRYLLTDEVWLTEAGQELEFETNGGHAYGEDVGLKWVFGTQFVAASTFPRRIRSRRKWRGSAADPQDSPTSVMINIQAEGAILRNVCCWLECDYTNYSPTNFGADVDIAIFIGCRVAVQIHDMKIIGYFRKQGVCLDVTNGPNLPRFSNPNGVPFPEGSVRNGADGLHMFNPYIYGSRQGFGIIGALPQPGQTTYAADYYDQILGTTVTDRRGNFGASDTVTFGGKIYGPDHHSDYRIADPIQIGGVLTQAGLESEPENLPGAVFIDGLAGNASGSVQGIVFIGCRIATFESSIVRINRGNRVSFIECHAEGRSGIRRDTAGNIIDTSNFITTTYGFISGTESAGTVTALGFASASVESVYPHWYGGPSTYLSDTGNLYLPGKFATRGNAFEFSQNDTALAALSDISLTLKGQSIIQETGEMDLRAAATQLVRLRVGSASAMQVGLTETRVNSGVLRMGGSSGPILIQGAGAPVIAAPIGSLFLRTDGTTGATFYVKESGTGSGGWVAK